MKRTNRCLPSATVAALAVATACALVSTPASAYCHKSTCSKNCTYDEYSCVSSGYGFVWPSLPIPYHFNKHATEHFDDADVRAVIRAAFKVWTRVECDDGRTSLVFAEGVDTNYKIGVGKTAPRDYGIYFRDLDWPATSNQNTLAETGQDFRGEGLVVGAAIQVDTFLKRFRIDDAVDAAGDDDDHDADAYDLQAVLTHEVGHYIGLDHSHEEDSVMVAEYCDGQRPCPKTVEELRTLGDDDRAAVCRLYPPSGLEKPPGCSTAGSSSDSRGPGTFAFLALPLAALLRSRSRSRNGARRS